MTKRFAILLSAASIVSCGHAPPTPAPTKVAPPPPTTRAIAKPPLASLLGFEDGVDVDAPRGWTTSPKGTVFADEKVVHGGKWSARMQRDGSSAGTFSRVSHSLPVDFEGKEIELHGYLKTEDVSEFAGLWVREDADDDTVAFSNMHEQNVKGTHDWTEYRITVPLKPEARELTFGALVSGRGTTWADDLELLVDGKPVWQAPRTQRPTTPLDRDHEFDRGSGVALDALSPPQIDNLVTLGKVWGFLKYHHPVVTSGKRHWDYDLFRVLPAVLATPDRAKANAAIVAWINTLGAVTDCATCADPPDAATLALKPDLDWIADSKALGPELASLLGRIHRARPADGAQFYVSFAPAGNPAFDHEPGYRDKDSDSGFRILAIYRFWNMVQYWFPYRDLVGKWEDALRESLPLVTLAKSRPDYQREMMSLIGRVHDSHANLWSGLDARPPTGPCSVPAVARFLGKDAVIDVSKAAELRRGDVVVTIDGVAPLEMARKLAPYYAASNDAARLRDFGSGMFRGECAPTKLTIRRGSKMLPVSVERAPIATIDRSAGSTHDRPGPAFQMLSKDIAYLKLSAVEADAVPTYLKEAADTKGWILDLRNYPSSFMVFALGGHFIDKPTDFVKFTSADLSNPGAFRWTPPLSLPPVAPRYGGKVVILVDEVSQSQAEYTAMAFRASPHAVIIGSTTAGADGNVSTIPLPGGLRSLFSGLGVFYPDKRPTQQVGVKIDIPMTPTVAGLAAGRDELVEAAIRQITGH